MDNSNRKLHDDYSLRTESKNTKPLVIAIAILVAFGAILCAAVFTRNGSSESTALADTMSASTSSTFETATNADSADALDRDGVMQYLMGEYPWSMTVRCEGHDPETFTLSNLIEDDLIDAADAIFATGESDVKISFDADADKINTDLQVMKYMWNVPAINSSISGYSAETETFSFTEPQDGSSINEEKLIKDINDAVAAGDFERVIEVETNVVKPELGPEEARKLYKTIATYITHSTANENRNSNLRIACNAINGTYLAPGESFSFNEKTGVRSAEKGYKEAAAYLNGETVQEAGGGVCQVASTLYNAAIRAGLKITERHAHTYEPSYVTPGEDSTVSYDGYNGPDLKFINNSKAGIVIKASYANQEVACSIIGVPILEEGEEISLHSQKVLTKDVIIKYINDPTLPIGSKVTLSAGTHGSRWLTNIIHIKNGEVISDEFLHSSEYKGHESEIRVGTAEVLPDVIPENQQGIIDGMTPVTGINGGPGVAGPGSLIPAEQERINEPGISPEQPGSPNHGEGDITNEDNTDEHEE